jgi:hypothetical protein
VISQPPDFIPSDGIGEPELPGSPLLRYAEHQRVSKRRPMLGYNPAVYTREPDTTTNSRPNGETRPRADAQIIGISRSPAPPPQTLPPNHPPPPVPGPSYSIPGSSTGLIAGPGTDRSTRASSSRTSHRVSQPLPNTPHGGENSRVPAKAPTPPPHGTHQPNQILFYGE